jgi:RecB family exonuclease
MSDFFTNKHEDYPDPVETTDPEFTGQVHSVSFSTLSTFEQCPYSVFLSKVQGIASKGNEASNRGSRLHELLENYVLGNTDEVNWKLFKAYDYHAPIIESFREAHSSKPKACVPEYQLAFNKNMVKTKWDAKNVWIRAMIDVMWRKSSTHAVLYDYKTGSNQSAAKHRSQLMLYALLYMLRNPKIESVEVAAIYLDLKIDNFYTSYNRNDINLYWPRYHARLKQVTECREFKPNPNGFTCKWCEHKKIQDGAKKPACAYAYTG